MTDGHTLILRGFERWQDYCYYHRREMRPKALTDFYAETFDEELTKRAALDLDTGKNHDPIKENNPPMAEVHTYSSTQVIPATLRIDSRAAEILQNAIGNPADDKLNSKEAAEWLGVSMVTLGLWRGSEGHYPPWSREPNGHAVYQRGDLLTWLAERRDWYAAKHQKPGKTPPETVETHPEQPDGPAPDPAPPMPEGAEEQAVPPVGPPQPIGIFPELWDDLKLANWLGVNVDWPSQARTRGFGPPYVVIPPDHIRYHRWQVIKWVNSLPTQTVESPQPVIPSRGSLSEKGQLWPGAIHKLQPRARLARPK